jgi:hypothetical protein
MEKVLQKELLGIVFALGFAVFQYETSYLLVGIISLPVEEN